MRIPNGSYQITNLETGAYAGLPDGNERSEVVNLALSLGDNGNRGSNVSLLTCSMTSTELDSMIVVDQAPWIRGIFNPERRL